ncbi:ABC transporter permease [Mesorhizobium sp. M7A.F.Ca.US.006.01.1.1]|uniref:ABC transporter permease n=1 Tax=Mesorhizobium sp. M7A.F.Ca.US.006.01.1.1 TaxID=2496707 RepID=UPI000FCAAD70|nr:ABC transporter permease [Mesorhizobium sp. M7A.F.Ca.US.006.01.1.1]RUZ71180.1 ABC transporter permease [Mesorhizobium sp. M7A.F.Ca.US.006.01.1.1]
MLKFIVARLMHAVPILVGVSLVGFLLMHLMPGNAKDFLIPAEASPRLAAQISAAYGFDQPIYIQYFKWLARTVQGDLGYSIFTGAPVADELAGALFNTVLLALPAAILGFTLGTLFGMTAAFHHGGPIDKLFSMLAISGVSMPHYWLAIVLVAIFSVSLNWFPAQGMGFSGFPASLADLKALVLPTITLALIPMGVVARVVRATTLDVLTQEFVVTLHAKGLLGRRIVVHILKNVAPASLAVMGLQFGYLLGGSILIETVFNWPGSGNLLNQAISRRDVPVMQACIVVLATFFVLLNLAVDIAQSVVDPRIRRQ